MSGGIFYDARTMNKPDDAHRRKLLQSMAGLAVGSMLPSVTAAAATVPGPTPGKPGDFEFLAGHWKISHHQMKPGTKQWIDFKGEATCWTVLDGVGSIEELRFPDRNVVGMGLRLLDVEKKVWSDFWVGARSGVLTTPGMLGSFENGAGIFEADDTDDGKPIRVKGVWDRITPTSCRWWQAVSWDTGKTWEENWFMDWQRA